MTIYVVVASTGEYEDENKRNLYAGEDLTVAMKIATEYESRARRYNFKTKESYFESNLNSIYIESWRDGKLISDTEVR